MKAKGRSSSAGVVRRRGNLDRNAGAAENVDVSIEDRTVASAPVRRVSLPSSAVRKPSALADSRSVSSPREKKVERTKQPSRVDSMDIPIGAGPGNNKGYLYLHEQARLLRGNGIVSMEAPIVGNSDNSNDGNDGTDKIHQVAVAGGSRDRPPSPAISTSAVSHDRRVSSVNGRSRVSSAAAVVGAGGGLSNHQPVKNALMHVCLAGVHLETARKESLLLLDQYANGLV